MPDEQIHINHDVIMIAMIYWAAMPDLPPPPVTGAATGCGACGRRYGAATALDGT
jgi:hypothetical protein